MWVQQGHYKIAGSIFRIARERAGLNQQQLAKQLAKPQSFVSSYERGQRRIDMLEFLKIVRAIGDDPSRVFAEILARFPSAKSKTSK